MALLPRIYNLGEDLRVQQTFDRFRRALLAALGVQTYDEGAFVRQATKMNFVGSGVLVTPDGGDPDRVVVTIPGSGSAALIASFDWTDWGAGLVAIGSVPAGRTVDKVKIIVDDVWNNNAKFTVGDAGDTSRLMPASASDPTFAYLYVEETFETYAVPTAVNLYFVGGLAPTQGTGRVMVQFV